MNHHPPFTFGSKGTFELQIHGVATWHGEGYFVKGIDFPTLSETNVSV